MFVVSICTVFTQLKFIIPITTCLKMQCTHPNIVLVHGLFSRVTTASSTQYAFCLHFKIDMNSSLLKLKETRGEYEKLYFCLNL